ncbi:copper ABC transporter permease [Bacillus timonensis]|uniref:Copper ABC transporter permease n=1 Tax=Bacillus timonensis TaxID=1033734 RepID=A0A4S3PTY5_9BACI|nr:ABC transporter permease subunit [Bacillus timonensis]THE13247.1 copper ABC transporter permease [Bacillus timonensis]
MHFIWKEWKEHIRSKGLWFSFIIVVFISISTLFKSSSLSFEQGIYVLLLNLFETLLYFIPIFCLFLGAFSIFQEKEQKTLVMLLTRNIPYSSFLFKKSIAIHSVLLVPIVSWFFLYLVPTKFMFQVDLKSYAIFVVSICSLCLIFTQFGILIGCMSHTKMQMIGYSIFIWFYFFFIHDFILLSFLPSVSYENVKLFSMVYFLNPLQASRMFLETGVGVFSFGHMSKLLQSFMWTNPTFFFLGNLAVLLCLSFTLAVFLNRRSVQHD